MLPFETRLALFPRRALVVRLGILRRLRLFPVTLARAAAMEAIGCGFLDGEMLGGRALLAAWVLSLPDGEVERAASYDMAGASGFVASLKGHTAAVEYAVNVLASEAVLPFIPPKSENGDAQIMDDGLPNGCGWPLEMAEALCAHYGWSFDEAMQTTVQRACALIAIGRIREGGSHGGPDYYERIRLERMRRLGIIPTKGKEASDG